MTKHVVDFSNTSAPKSERRLADLPDRVIEGDPHHKTVIHFNSPDDVVMAGTWVSTRGKWHAFIDRDEFCYIIDGHAQLISDDGTVQDFRKGDALLIPDGFRGCWNVIETTTKHFVIRQ